MGLLYPRLFKPQAEELRDRYLSVPVIELARYSCTDHPSAVYAATGGDRVTAQALAQLRDKVLRLADEYAFPAAPRGEREREFGEFDRRLSVLLHSGMDIVPADAASREVWSFIALVLLPDISRWRKNDLGGDTALPTDITRHIFGRLWWRAHLVRSPDSQDPYGGLRILGEEAFDQIQTRRRALGASPQLINAILTVWSTLDRQGIPERPVLRDFLKRLLRLVPFTAFEALDAQTLKKELREIALETVAAMKVATATTGGGAGGSRSGSTSDDQGSESGDDTSEWQAGTDAPAPDRAGTDAPADRDDGDAVGEPEPRSRPGGEKQGPMPYQEYSGPEFGKPQELGLVACATVVAQVVAQEGPVTAERVFHVITRLSGTRLSSKTEEVLLNAVRYAARKGWIEAEDQRGRLGYAGATLRTPGQPLCVLRERGPRDLDEIPGRELLAGLKLVEVDGERADIDELIRRTARLFGYEKASERIRSAFMTALSKYEE